MAIATTYENDYLEWLFKIQDDQQKDAYGNLLYWLYHQPFRAIVPNDDNRISDGLALRDQFGIQLDLPCSMLEMLIALAKRMDYILFDRRYGRQTEKWFWLMIRNLKLEYIDEHDKDPSKNYSIISRFMERKYNPKGAGGLFPLKHARDDQRNIEIWYQMMAYINENFEI